MSEETEVQRNRRVGNIVMLGLCISLVVMLGLLFVQAFR